MFSAIQVELVAEFDHEPGFAKLSPKLTEIDTYLYGAIQYYEENSNDAYTHRGPLKTRFFRYPLSVQ